MRRLTWPILLGVGAAVAVAATLGTWKLAPAFLGSSAPDMPAFPLLHGLCHWDCWWYVNIAGGGYWFRPGEQSPVAYFPAYPLLIRAVTLVGLDRFSAAVLVSLGSGVGALLLYGRWAEKVRPGGAGVTAAWLLALYPYAVYLYGVVYSDALFLLLVIGAFLALESDRPVLAAVLGMAATAARPVAPAVVLGLLVRSLERRRRAKLPIRAVDFVPALAGLGLVGWMAYLQVKFGDPLAFVHVQSAPGWGQPPGPATWLKLDFFHTLFEAWRPFVFWRHVPQMLIALSLLGLVVPTWRRLGAGYGVYLLVVVAIPTVSSKDFMGLGRYGLAAFPAWLTVATWLDQRPRLRSAWLAVSGVLLLVVAFAFGGEVYLS
ncbi:MAG: hypothetical protein AB1938_27335 [Myxococcota bacterium]